MESTYTYFSHTDHTEHAEQLKRESILSDPSITFKHTLPNHTEYKPTSSSQTLQFSNLLKTQLLRRQQDKRGNMESRRDRLRKQLMEEDMYTFYKRTIKRYDETRHLRLVPVEWTVPCIMHMHNRVVEKIVCVLLRKGYSLQLTVESKKLFLDSVEATMNYCILGSINSQCTWKVPMTKDSANIGSEISFSDGKAKLVMIDIGLLVSDSFNDGKF